MKTVGLIDSRYNNYSKFSKVIAFNIL